MTQTYFEELMQEGFACSITGKAAFGVHDGWPYSVEMDRKTGESAFGFRLVVCGRLRSMLARLKEQAVPHVVWDEEYDRGAAKYPAAPETTANAHTAILTAWLTPPSDFYAKGDIHSVLVAATAALEAEHLHPPAACPLCGLARCDAWAFLDDGYRAAHIACLDARLDLPEKDETPSPRAMGFLPLGILGALVGAVFGALPNFAMAMGQEPRLHFALYAFIPIFAALGYRVARGKAVGWQAWVTVLAASFAATFGLELVWAWVEQSFMAQQNLPFGLTTARYFQNNNIVTAVRQMLLYLLMVMVGMFPARVILRHYEKKGTIYPRPVRGAAYVRQSITPINPAAPDETNDAKEKPDDL